MPMEDHHHHQQQQQRVEQQQQHYTDTSMGDLRQFINMNAPTSSTTLFPSISVQPIADLFPGHPNLNLTHHHHYHHDTNMMAFARPHHDFASVSDSAALNTNITVASTTPAAAAAAASTPPLSSSGLETEAETAACFPGDASTGRWPRQETLTLLEIRSRLHPQFKQANQKGPLWDELSRIMCEEFGYQRSGKKCREKFENLYKYYKKTKEGKAGRQDGKHYRFFRQLEALCGENTNPSSAPEANFGSSSLHDQFQPSKTNQETTMFKQNSHSVSLTNSTELDTSSSGENDSAAKRRKRRWREKIKEFIDSQMKEVMEKQEAWLERLMKTLEEKEKERVMREEEWSRQEAARLEREHKFWAKERAWIEARDAALMEALQKLTGINTDAKAPLNNPAEFQNQNEDGSEILHESWEDSEITTLLQMRAEVESRFGQSECSEEAMWEEVATKMVCFGYQKTASMCKHKWENITNYTRIYAKEGSRKRKENSTRCFYFHDNDHSSLYNQGSGYCNINQQHRDGSSPSNSNVGNAASADGCFPLFMCDTENLWQNYGFKLNKGNQNPDRKYDQLFNSSDMHVTLRRETNGQS